MFRFRSLLRPSLQRICRRWYLSPAYDCNAAWQRRLDSKILQKINIETMYYDLDSQYNRKKKLIAIDVDIFLNAQTDDAYLMEVEEIVHKLRLTENALNTLPTTHHAFVRLFQSYSMQNLIRILYDRFNYGIFPDDYLIVYLVDKLLKENNVRDAAKVGCLQMFQEDYSHELCKYFSLYSIHRYILTNEPWEENPPPPPEEDDDEEVKIRVTFLRNPHFDDHFDLRDGNHICGKSLVMISSTLENAAAKNSYKIMGFALYNKWEKLENELSALVSRPKDEKEPILYKESVEFVNNILKEKITDENVLNKLTGYLADISVEKCINDSLLDATEKQLKEYISAHETDIIKSQEKLYQEWEELRERTLNEHLKDVEIKRRLDAVEIQKQELMEKEQLMYFFENEDQIDIANEKKKLLMWKRAYNSTKEDEEAEYVPPEIKKKEVLESPD